MKTITEARRLILRMQMAVATDSNVLELHRLPITRCPVFKG